MNKKRKSVKKVISNGGIFFSPLFFLSYFFLFSPFYSEGYNRYAGKSPDEIYSWRHFSHFPKRYFYMQAPFEQGSVFFIFRKYLKNKVLIWEILGNDTIKYFLYLFDFPRRTHDLLFHYFFLQLFFMFLIFLFIVF